LDLDGFSGADDALWLAGTAGAVSQFVDEQLAVSGHGGIGPQVSAFAQAQHSGDAATAAGRTVTTDASDYAPGSTA
jgi:hypothetical protein